MSKMADAHIDAMNAAREKRNRREGRYRRRFTLDPATGERARAYKERCNREATMEHNDPELSALREAALAKQAARIKKDSGGELGY